MKFIILYINLNKFEKTILKKVIAYVTNSSDVQVDFYKVLHPISDDFLKKEYPDHIVVAVYPDSEKSIFYKRISGISAPEISLKKTEDWIINKKKRKEIAKSFLKYRKITSEENRTILSKYIPSITIDAFKKMKQSNKIFKARYENQVITIVPNEKALPNISPKDIVITYEELLMLNYISKTFNINSVTISKGDTTSGKRESTSTDK